MADNGDDLLDGDGLLGDAGDFGEDLDGDAEDALLADDSAYSDHYNLRTVPSSGREVYLDSERSSAVNAVRAGASDTIYHEVEEIAEGDEIIDEDEEDILDLGVTDEFENELQDHPHNASSTPIWIKQERVDQENISSIVVGNRMHQVIVDEPNSGTAIKQEPFDVTDVKQSNVIVTSSTELFQDKFNSQVNESDEEENNDDDDQRDRFKTERTNVISLKKNNSINKWGEIPDSLDNIVPQQFNQNQRGPQANRGGGGPRRGKIQHGQQHSSHKIHINPHFKKTSDHLPPQVQPWDNRVLVQQQPPFNSPIMQHTGPPQHYGPRPPQSPHMIPQGQPPPPHPPHQGHHHSIPPPAPPQMYHQQQALSHEHGPNVQHHPPHVPQVHPQSPAQWVRSDGPQPHFEPQFGTSHPVQHHGPPQQINYQQSGPQSQNNAVYPPRQHQQQHPPPYDQNLVQHHPPPPLHHLQPPPAPQHQQGYDYQQQPPMPQPPPPGAEDGGHCNPIRTVQFSQDSRQITVQMTTTPDVSHYNTNQQFNNSFSQPPQNQNNIWNNRPMAPPHPLPRQQLHQQQQFRPPGFVHPGQRLPHPQQQPMQHLQVPRGQNPRFIRGGNFRRGVGNRYPAPRHHMLQNRPLFTGDMSHIPPSAGPGGDCRFVGTPSGGIGKRIGEVHQPPPVPFKQARFNVNNHNMQQPISQQVRKGPVMSNLCEVPTVDNVPDTTTKIEPPIEDEDEETREYRLKIAEQKLKREKFLMQKEMRRQMAAVKKQQEIEQKLFSEQPAPQAFNNETNVPIVQNSQPVQNQNQVNVPRQSVHQRIGAKVIVPVNNIQNVNNTVMSGYKIVKVRAKDGTIHIKKMPLRIDGALVNQQSPKQMQNLVQHNFNNLQNLAPQPFQHNQFHGNFIVPTINRRIVVDNSMNHKQVLNKNSFHAARKRAIKKNMTPVTTIIPTAPPAKPMTLGQRFSIQASQQQQQSNNNTINQQQLQQQSSIKSNRKVISSSSPGKSNIIKVTASAVPSEPVSCTVVVDNLTASTSREQIVKMARQVGEFEKVSLEPKLKRATIKFKTTNSASAFYLKFQRKMVDLSMINVSFVPEVKTE